MHGDLVALLGSLRDAEWAAPTEAGHWTVKDVALHLLGRWIPHGGRRAPGRTAARGPRHHRL